jgi:transcriptional regulator with XRE-family HTH domain
VSPADFARWRELMSLNRTQAAEALGVSRNMPAKYEAGTAPIPLTVALACAALIRGISPWPS